MDDVEVSWLIGKTCSAVVQNGNDEVHFVTNEGTLILYHDQDCCESVTLEEVHGDLADLVGTPILVAEEREEDLPKKSEWDEASEWTFYEFRTIKGSVTMRWYGTSNGYYSTRVDKKVVKS